LEHPNIVVYAHRLAGVDIENIIVGIRGLGNVVDILGLGHVDDRLDQRRGLEEKR
jgi:hypothetical protein